MPTTNSLRMKAIADHLENEGAYTMSFSVEAITAERDALLRRVEALEGLAAIREAQGDALRAYAVGVAYRHLDAISAVPAGYDTVLGYLAKFHPDVLDSFDYTDPATTARDGFWLKHRCPEPMRVTAPACLQAHGINHVNAYPVDLLARRWG